MTTRPHSVLRLWLLPAAVLALSCQTTEVVEGFPEHFAGVGLELKIRGKHPVVVRPLRGGPAHTAGLKRGDKVLAIDGESVEGETLGNVVMKLRGPPDSQVNIDIERGTEHIVVVVRRKVMKKVGENYRAQK